MHPGSISIHDYSYPLPEGRIASHPLAERDASKLLIFRDGFISETIYRNIDAHLPANSLLVFNNTRVVEARLLFQKPTGGLIEIFCLEPGDQYPDITTGMLRQSGVYWKCLIGGASKWKHGQVLQQIIPGPKGNLVIEARFAEKLADCFLVELSWQPAHLSFAEVLHSAGHIPLPPYIKRNAAAEDNERYQTIYAREDGSVAAPTAGLHFTPAIFNNLERKNIKTAFVTLHVGAGTFKPVKAASLQEHDMHAEFVDVDAGTINTLLQFPGKIFSVGTTSARTLESLYWMGVKAIRNPDISQEDIEIGQWEPYRNENDYAISTADALRALLRWLEGSGASRLLTKTRLLIAPGYRFRVARGLVTNFHQPQSTLLLLVAALIGDDWKKVYSYALDHDFRFLSYGDGCLLFGR